jgi:hypothetical protein
MAGTAGRSRIVTCSRVTADGTAVDAAKSSPAGSIFPEAIETVATQLGVAHRVLDIAVTHEVLQRSSIDAVVGELEAAGVAQHVGMRLERQLGHNAEAVEQLQEPGPGDRAPSLGVEDVAALQVLAAQLAQRPDLLAGQRMGAVGPVLRPADVDAAGVQLDLRPFQIAQLGGAERVAIGD